MQSAQRATAHRVVITDFIADDLAPERQVLSEVARVEALDAGREDELLGRVEGADALMVYHTFSLTRQTIARLERCKLIVRCGVGVDNVDWAFAAQRGIPVANVPDYGTEDVADTAIGMMLALTRGINLYNSALRSARGTWAYTQAAPLRRLRGRVFGVVGLGRIGTAAALRARALGMEVLFYDPFKPDGYDKAFGVRRSETLEALLGQVQVLSLHCPLTDQTRNLIDSGAILRMPRGSYLVNTARGQLVDTKAVAAALEAGHLAGAALDVLPHEPPKDDDPLVIAWQNPAHPAHGRLILNPHAAFYTEEGLIDMRIKGAQACKRAILGQPVRNVVNNVEPGR